MARLSSASPASLRRRPLRRSQPRRRSPRRVAIGCILLLAVAAAAEAELRQVFVTSVYGTADFSQWPAAEPGASGTDAADSICRALAAAAGLAHAPAYRAWLSSSVDDAWCRAQGLSGLRNDGCDAAPVLPGAGPWARTGDGARWAGKLSSLADLQGPLVPLDRDQHGFAIPEYELLWTGSDPTGRAYDPLAAELCDDWTSSAGTSVTALGSTAATRGAWTISFGGACADHRRLVCLETGAGGGRPPTASLGPAALAFVTGAVGTGDLASWPGARGLTGVAAADSACRVEAAAAHLPNPESFVAWLSTAAQNARGRLPLGLAWRRVDGVGIATGRAELLDGRLAAPINETAAAAYLPRPPAWAVLPWTGTAYDGVVLAGVTCRDWTSTVADDSGLAGAANSNAADWTDGRPYSCASRLPLYCFSTVEILFWDGFEAGHTLEWSYRR